MVDAERAADAKSRLAAITTTTGPITQEQAAFAGLVHAAGLDAFLYPKQKGLVARNRSAAIARQDRTIAVVGDAPTLLTSAVGASTGAAVNAATQVATAIQAATLSALQSAVNTTHHLGAQHHHGGGHYAGGGMGGGHHGGGAGFGGGHGAGGTGGF